MFETVKTHKWKLLVSSVIILLPVLAGVLLWDRLPERMAIHWGFNGEPDGWASRDLAVFGLPVFMLVLNWVCLLAEKRNFTINPKPMALVFFVCPVVSVVCGALMYADVLGIEIQMRTWALALMGVMFIALGNYLPKCRQNYTLGIKLKWTYESEENWNATHRFGGRVWVACGALMLASVLLPGKAGSAALLVLALAACILPVAYSWRYARRQG